MIKIVVDLMGADKNARELVSGAIKAINENKDLTCVLCVEKAISNIAMLIFQKQDDYYQ